MEVPREKKHSPKSFTSDLYPQKVNAGKRKQNIYKKNPQHLHTRVLDGGEKEEDEGGGEEREEGDEVKKGGR